MISDIHDLHLSVVPDLTYAETGICTHLPIKCVPLDALLCDAVLCLRLIMTLAELLATA